MKTAIAQKSLLSLILLGARPKTLTASFFPVILGMCLARFEGYYNLSLYLATLVCAAFVQIGTNYANDYFDAKAGRDTKKRLGPPRLAGGGLMPRSWVFTLMVASFVIATLSAIPLMMEAGTIVLYLMILAIALGILYTYGKYSLANTGLSNLTIFVVFGPFGTFMAYYLQTGVAKLNPALYGIIPGCLSLMMFAMNNLRDYEEDKEGGKKTLVVRFGFAYGKMEYLLALAISWMTIPLSMMLYKAPLITMLPLIWLPKAARLAKDLSLAEKPTQIVPLFEKTAKYILLFALTYILAWRIAMALS
ncbi:1,4-dihydroxy-2-naphthoate octaprenyltransferase [bacterium]|nr:1,4-dihydroxy-2-naphthoate octaprenyltransferase [bacterium]